MSVDDLIYKSKVPSSSRKHVGIEIECLIPANKDATLIKLLNEKKLQWNINVGSDGSVRDDSFIMDFNERFIGKEIRILAEEKDAPKIINEVCTVLKVVGAKVNKTCGLHVHIDLRNRDFKMVYENLFQFQSVMFKMQPKSRHKNQYCKKLTKKNREGNIGRHYSINKNAYTEHRTAEVRLHEGTIDAKDIRMWVYFLIHIANMEKTLTSSIRKIDKIEMPIKLKEYINARIKRFAS